MIGEHNPNPEMQKAELKFCGELERINFIDEPRPTTRYPQSAFHPEGLVGLDSNLLWRVQELLPGVETRQPGLTVDLVLASPP